VSTFSLPKNNFLELHFFPELFKNLDTLSADLLTNWSLMDKMVPSHAPKINTKYFIDKGCSSSNLKAIQTNETMDFFLFWEDKKVTQFGIISIKKYLAYVNFLCLLFFTLGPVSKCYICSLCIKAFTGS
jgi:hypothetical protein